MTLSLHKLWAGSGYEYLTRQVARSDASHPRGGLSAYYEERGESPGTWVGRGLDGVEGLAAGDLVSAEQMRLLFGEGRHPLADQLVATAPEVLDGRDRRTVGHLGAPFRRAEARSGFAEEVESRLAEKVGPTDPAPSAEARAQAMSSVATDWFVHDHGRSPADPRELAGAVARYGRPPARPVAGFDLTFSPVKSVSALWAVADRPVSDQIERAHRAAVGDALGLVDGHPQASGRP